jgi:hypothetical protein
MTLLLAARFWPNVERRTLDECWPWTGRTMTSGYGVFPVNAGEIDDRPHSSAGAHRVAFYLVHGGWPDKALHGCDYKLCCNAENPEHVHSGTLALNNQEMFARGRARPRGKVPLTDDQKMEIVRRYTAGGVRQVDLAAEFGRSQRCISFVLQAAGAAPGKRQGSQGRFV